MAVEFRTSFLGFNRDDVLNYVHKKDAETKVLVASFKDKIQALEKELSALKADFSEAVKNNSELSQKNEELTSALNVYKEKEAEIESLGRKIGKLYLVSKSSAKSIVDRAEENAAVINEQAEMRLKNITETEDSLHEITKQIVSASEKYVSELGAIETSLAEAKMKISERDAERVRISEEFAEIYEQLS